MGPDVTTPIPPGASTPDWYHADNLFPSRERMDEVHAPIVAQAAAALGGRGGAVLDLGCGNGALLEKIHRAAAGVVPFGVDLEEERIAHARVLLPGFAAHFVTADLAEPGTWCPDDRRFELALLTPRRLEQAGPVRAERLLAWLRARCERLLVYGYGTALTQHDSLQGFAARFGIRLAHDEPGVTVSLAERF